MAKVDPHPTGHGATPLFNVRLPHQLREAVLAEAARRGLTASSYVREVLADAVDTDPEAA